jgi:hypothetical protein
MQAWSTFWPLCPRRAFHQTISTAWMQKIDCGTPAVKACQIGLRYGVARWVFSPMP